MHANVGTETYNEMDDTAKLSENFMQEIEKVMSGRRVPTNSSRAESEDRE